MAWVVGIGAPAGQRARGSAPGREPQEPRDAIRRTARPGTPARATSRVRERAARGRAHRGASGSSWRGRLLRRVSIVAALGLAVVYWTAASPSSRASSSPWPSAASASASCCGPSTSCPTTRWPRSASRSSRPRRRSTPSATTSSAASTSLAQPPPAGAHGRRGACAALGVALLFPIRSLGPRPGQGPQAHAVRRRRRAARHRGRAAVRAAELSRSTAWSPSSPRATPTPPTPRRCSSGSDRRDVRAPPGPGGLDRRRASSPTRSSAPTRAARSGSTRPSEQLLLCPCHQSTFDVLDGARPVFGPAARPLPQLPLDVDDDGLPDRHRRLLRPGRARLLGPGPLMARSAGAGPEHAADPPTGPRGSTTGSAPPSSPAPRSTRCSPTTGRSCSASSPSTASWCCCSPAST